MQIKFKNAFVLALGDSITGTTLYGPFHTREEAFNKSSTSLQFKKYSIHEVNLKKSVVIDIEQPIYVRAIGNPFAGITLETIYQDRREYFDIDRRGPEVVSMCVELMRINNG